MDNLIRFKKTATVSLMAILMAGTLMVAPSTGASDKNNGHGNNCDGIDSSNPGKGSPNGKNSNHNETDASVDDEGKNNCSSTASTATGTLTPDSYSKTIEPEETVSVERTVTVNVDDIVETTITSKPQKLDVLFLADNTGSMGSAISNVQDNARSLLNELSADYDDVQVGVARYYGDPKEYGSATETTTVYVPTGNTVTYSTTGTYTGKLYGRGRRTKYEYEFVYKKDGTTINTWKAYYYGSTHSSWGGSYYSSWESPEYETIEKPVGEAAYELQEGVDGGSVDDAIAAINNWSATGGGDWPEANFFALQQAATSGNDTDDGYYTNYDTNWRSDAKKIIVWFGDAQSHTSTVSQNQVIDALQDNDVSVIAIHATTTSYSLTNGINKNSQASTIASETDGEFASVYSSEVAETMASLIGEVAVETTTTTDGTVDLEFSSTGDTDDLNITYTCTDPLGCTAVKDGESRTFEMNVTGTKTGTYDFKTLVVDVPGAVADNTIIVNGLPTTGDDKAQTYLNESVTVDVLDNDSDPDFDPNGTALITDVLNITKLDNQAVTSEDGSSVSVDVSGGIAYVDDNGKIVYEAGDTEGTYSIEYTLEDNRGATSTGTLTIEVITRSINKAPVTESDTAETYVNDEVSVDVLSNDEDPDSEAKLTITKLNGEALSDEYSNVVPGGTAYVDDNGKIVYEAGGEAGKYTFEYTVEDDKGATSNGTLTITVRPEVSNKAPVVTDDEGETYVNHTVSIDVLSNDFDPEASEDTPVKDTLSIIKINGQEIGDSPINVPGGTAYVDENEQIVFTAGNTKGDYEFTYTVEDNEGATSNGTLSIEVTVVPD